MTTLVFSYSHTDEALRNELEKHLSPLKRMGKITTWHDRRIVPGEEFENQIDYYFSTADIILLLISSDFIDSDYCYQTEMSNALQRHERGDAIVIPVILRPCAWHQLPFGKLLAATVDGKPIVQFSSYDDGFVQVVDAVNRALDKFAANAPQSSTGVLFGQQVKPMVGNPSSTVSPMSPRSSNLSIPKTFTDLDKDRACRDGFDYLSRFFENSLEELKKRNEGLDTDFSRRDADAFSCTIYQHGRKVCHCGIWRNPRGTGIGDICYSQGGLTQNSWNESMTVANNGQLIGFRPLMGGYAGSSREALLTEEGMAEHFWGMFFNPLKQRY